MIKIGERLEGLKLKNQQGETVRLKKGKEKIIFCFPKASTPG